MKDNQLKHLMKTEDTRVLRSFLTYLLMAGSCEEEEFDANKMNSKTIKRFGDMANLIFHHDTGSDAFEMVLHHIEHSQQKLGRKRLVALKSSLSLSLLDYSETSRGHTSLLDYSETSREHTMEAERSPNTRKDGSVETLDGESSGEDSNIQSKSNSDQIRKRNKTFVPTVQKQSAEDKILRRLGKELLKLYNRMKTLDKHSTELKIAQAELKLLAEEMEYFHIQSIAKREIQTDAQ